MIMKPEANPLGGDETQEHMLAVWLWVIFSPSVPHFLTYEVGIKKCLSHGD